MNTTINISMPKSLLKEIKKTSKQMHYSSVSEFIRDAARGVIFNQKERITVNGFTPEFEEKVLQAEKEPVENDTHIRTEKDLQDFFDSFN